MNKLLLILTMAVSGAAGAESLTVDKDRLIKVIGPVDGGAVDIANDIVRLSETKQPIYIMVNSPGGNVFTGNLLIQGMKMAQLKGIPVYCFSSIWAMSMGLTILLHCDKVYVFSVTQLMFHPAKVASRTPLGAGDLKKHKEKLEYINKKQLALLSSKFNFTNEQLITHFKDERVWDGEELLPYVKGEWLVVVNAIYGIRNVFQYK